DPTLKAAVADLNKMVLPQGPVPTLSGPDGPDYSRYTNMSAAQADWTEREKAYAEALMNYKPTGISADAAKGKLADADDALQSLNQDNELTLMRLNTLMQQRVQVTTKGTEQLASINQCIQAILQNMR